MSVKTSKQPWPSDALMVVASLEGQERREHMESVVPAACRDCGAALAADSFTIRTAWNLPVRRGRPVKFFCMACAHGYDMRSIDQLHDHSVGGFGRKTHSAAVQCQLFNERFPIGSEVRYWLGAREGPGREGKTRSEAFVLGNGSPCVFLAGIAGCVALSHVEPVIEG